MTTMTEQGTDVCCPEFRSEKWDEKTFDWKEKHFIKSSVPALFHIPLKPMLKKQITQLMEQAEVSKRTQPELEETLLLFNDPHAFKSEVYLSVEDDIPSAQNTTLTGTFMTKVYDGAYRDIPKFFKKMNNFLADQGKRAKNYYVHYAYCPKCAKKYGHNYMVFFAELG